MSRSARLTPTCGFECAASFRRIREQLGIPFLHVTGSETEALAMGDRLIVLDSGKMSQFGRPSDIYDRPANPNVARFLNCYNVFDGSIEGDTFRTHSRELPARRARGER